MTKALKIIALMLLINFNIFGQTSIVFKKAEHYKTKDYDVALFSANYVDLFLEQRFTPTRQEVDQAEKALYHKLKISNKQLVNQTTTPLIHLKLNKYQRQYFGYIDKNGDRILLINCFWSYDKNKTKHWLTNRIMVLDGGSYYWDVKFNLDKKELFDLNINGYA